MNTYLIISETIYHTNEALKKIKKDIKNTISFNMEENNIDDILSEASYLSLFNEDKCIIVRNAKFLGTLKDADSKKNKEISEKILKYLEHENEHTKLIFILNGKADTKKKIYKLIKDNNNLYISPSLTKTEMKNELSKICNENKYSINDKSLWHILNNSLGNFDLAYNELIKIMTYYGKPGEIKYEDVINLTSKTIEENNFKLVDSIINRDIKSSLKLLEESRILKIEPTIIISLLYREFKLMLATLIYEENKMTISEILSNLNLTEWMLDKVHQNLRKYHKKEIKEEIVKLSKLDYNLKSGNINKDIALVSYIVDSCL